MLSQSFRSFALEIRVYPRPPRRKRSALAVLALVLLLSGCGGGGGGGGGGGTTEQAPTGQHVTGKGFTFTAPADWRVTHASTTVTVRPSLDQPTLASVTT